ncbi:hypothetical protein K3495_g7378 [Podosphaera aphanis]|nr:hypothetical protein K3495_g7378 [Podosphaera aphanis]
MKAKANDRVAAREARREKNRKALNSLNGYRQRTTDAYINGRWKRHVAKECRDKCWPSLPTVEKRGKGKQRDAEMPSTEEMEAHRVWFVKRAKKEALRRERSAKERYGYVVTHHSTENYLSCGGSVPDSADEGSRGDEEVDPMEGVTREVGDTSFAGVEASAVAEETPVAVDGELVVDVVGGNPGEIPGDTGVSAGSPVETRVEVVEEQGSHDISGSYTPDESICREDFDADLRSSRRDSPSPSELTVVSDTKLEETRMDVEPADEDSAPAAPPPVEPPSPMTRGRCTLSGAQVYDAEIHGAMAALKAIIASKRHLDRTTIYVLLDNLEAVHGLQTGITTSSAWRVQSFKHMTRQIATSVQVRWIPGHQGIRGNEAADQLAKAALEADTAPTTNSGLVTLASIKRMARDSSGQLTTE